MSITSKLLDNFRKDLEEATKGLQEKHGVILDFGAMTYNDTQFTFKTTATLGQSKEDVERVQFNADKLKMYDVNLIKVNYGDEILLQGLRYKLVGLKPRASKMPVVVEQKANGKRYKISMSTLKRNLI